MANKFIEASYVEGKHNVNVGVTLMLWEEAGIFYQYSPQLDLTGYGNSAGEARESFEHVLEEFITYTMNKGTIFDELERLGWTTNKKKKKLRAPEDDQLLQDNDTYKELITMPGMHRELTNLALSL